MVEHIERETLSAVSIEIRLEEVVASLEEIPSMVKLDTPQLRKVVLRIFGAQSVVENGCHEDDGGANSTSDELVVPAGDEIRESRVESRHEVGRKQGRRGNGVLSPYRVEDWVKIYPCVSA